MIKTIHQIQSIESFVEYSNFTNKEDFNNQYNMYMADYKSEFTKTEYMVLQRLKKFAVKVTGVVVIRQGKLAEYIAEHDFALGVSVRTIRRCLAKMENIGMLTSLPTKRKNGYYSCNIYVYNRYADRNKDYVFTRKVSKLKIQNSLLYKKSVLPNKTTTSDKPLQTKGEIVRKLDKQKTDTTVSKTVNQIRMQEILQKKLDSTFVPNHIPKEFVDAIRPYINDANEIYQLWGRALLVWKKRNINEHIELEVDILIEAFKSTVFAYKRNWIKNSFKGYYYRTLDTLVHLYIRRGELTFVGQKFNTFNSDWLTRDLSQIPV